MVAINDFCWSAFLTKSALFLKFAPPGKKTPAPLSMTTADKKKPFILEITTFSPQEPEAPRRIQSNCAIFLSISTYAPSFLPNFKIWFPITKRFLTLS